MLTTAKLCILRSKGTNYRRIGFDSALKELKQEARADYCWPYNKRPRLLPSLYNNSLFVTRTRELALIHAASLRRGKQSGVEERDGPFQDNDERPAVCEAFGRRISSRRGQRISLGMESYTNQCVAQGKRFKFHLKSLKQRKRKFCERIVENILNSGDLGLNMAFTPISVHTQGNAFCSVTSSIYSHSDD